MTEEESSTFTTKRRSIGSDGELKWGGEDGESWSDAVESSENMTVTDDGTITTGSEIPDSAIGQYDVQSLSGFSDSDTVSTIPNLIDGTDMGDATGAEGTYTENAINGNPGIKGSNGSYDLNFSINDSHLENGFSTIFVHLDDPVSSDREDFMQTGFTDPRWYAVERGSGDEEWQFGVGDSFTEDSGIHWENEPQVVLMTAQDGNANFETNKGEQTTSLSYSASGSRPLSLMGGVENDPFNGFLGEVIFYDENIWGTETLEYEYKRIENKWGVNL